MKRLGIVDKKVKHKKEENWEKEWEKDHGILGIYNDTFMQLTKGRNVVPMSEEELDQLVDEYMQSREKEETKQRSQKRLEKMVQEFEEEKESKWAEEYAKEQSDKWVKEYDKSILDFFISPSERQVIKQMIQKLIPEQKKMVVDMVMQSNAVLKMKPEEQRKYVSEFIRNLAKQSGRPSKY